MVTDILGSVLDLSFDANGFSEATPTTMDLSDPFSDPPLFAVDLPLGLRLDMDMDAFTQMQTAANYYHPMMSFVDEEAHRKQLQQQYAQHQQQQQLQQKQQQQQRQVHHHQPQQQQQTSTVEFATPSSPLTEMMRLHFEAKHRDERNPAPAPQHTAASAGFQNQLVQASSARNSRRQQQQSSNNNTRRQRARASAAPYTVPVQQTHTAVVPAQAVDFISMPVTHQQQQFPQQQQPQYFAPQPPVQSFSYAPQNAFFLPFDALHPY